MVEGVIDYSNYILAGLAAGSAGLGAYRWYRGSSAKRKRRQAEYQALWQRVFGRPALVDDRGIEYEAAIPGLDQLYTELSGAFYGHTTHPPHPGRRREDRESGDP